LLNSQKGRFIGFRRLKKQPNRINAITTSQLLERSAILFHGNSSRFLRWTVSFWLDVLVIWNESAAGDISSSPASPFTNSTIPTDG
jgi:hypothetical protein